MTLDTLFDQVKGVHIIGPRLSGEPEVLHEIEDYFRKYNFFPIVRDQIKVILQNVPSPLPENWKSPAAYADLNSVECTLYTDIAHKGVYPCPGPVIQKVIELAVGYRDRGKPTGQPV